MYACMHVCMYVRIYTLFSLFILVRTVPLELSNSCSCGENDVIKEPSNDKCIVVTLKGKIMYSNPS